MDPLARLRTAAPLSPSIHDGIITMDSLLAIVWQQMINGRFWATSPVDHSF